MDTTFRFQRIRARKGKEFVPNTENFNDQRFKISNINRSTVIKPAYLKVRLSRLRKFLPN